MLCVPRAPPTSVRSENGFQTGNSCLKSYKLFDDYLTDNNIERPVVMITDGHSSRMDLEVLKFCQDKQIYQFVSPPDTTGLLQLLDQVNSLLHSCYASSKEQLFTEDRINRETFMTLLSGIWSDWFSKDSIVKAFKRCGIEPDKLSVSLMQQDKFFSAALLETPKTPSSSGSKWNITSPEGLRKGTAEYWKKKCLQYEEKLEEISKIPFSPDEIEELTSIEKIKISKSKNFRITQVSGSMRGEDILNKRLELEEQEQLKSQKKALRVEKKQEQTEAFLQCKQNCICLDEVCQAAGLKQCPNCKTVMKSQCSKAKCQVNGVKPTMLIAGKSKSQKKVLENHH